MPVRRIVCRKARAVAVAAATALLLASGAGAAVGWASSAAAQTEAAGARPTPLGEEATAGPLRLRVLEVVVGPEAADLVAAASPTNEPTREGIGYVLVNLRVRNVGETSIPLDGGDFALTGASGLVRRFAGTEPPAPALDGTLEPGASRDGWIVLTAPDDETDLRLRFDSLTLPGRWADRVLALEEDAALPAAPAPVAPNEAGVDAADPAGLATPVVTAEWGVELVEVVGGAAVFDLVDYRTGALGPDTAADATPWLALLVRVTNVGASGGEGEPAALPPNAFVLVDENGAPIPDVLTLTPPRPDAAGAYEPGASREGWVAFELPADAVYTVRFLPYPTTAADADPRYLTYA